MIPFKSMLDQIMWNTSKSVSKVKECYVQSFLVDPCILNYFFKYYIVFNASIYSRKESLLHFWIDKTIAEEIVGDPLGKNEMIGLANSTGQCDHPKVSGIFIRTFLVNEFNQTL